MGVKIEKHSETGGPGFGSDIEPTEPHKWLDWLGVNHDPEKGTLKVAFWIKPEYQEPQIKDRSVPDRSEFSEALHKMRSVATPVSDMYDNLDFDATDIPRASAILTASGIPRDMQTAALDEIKRVQQEMSKGRK